MVKSVLFGIVVLVLVFFYGVIPWFLTNIATTSRFHFHDPNDGKTPKSYGMDFHEVEFRTSDGILLKGWYLPATTAAKRPARGTMVFCHGHNRTRVEMLPEAQFAHELGFNCVLFDLRHQGQSGGEITSVGFWERLDAEAAAGYALSQENAERPVVLWGVSMGAAAALMAAAESPAAAAVISDSSFLSYPDVVRHHYYLFRGFASDRWWWFPALPSFPIADEVIYWSGWRAHFSPKDFDLEQAVRRLGAKPVLFVAVQGDRRMPPSIARTLYSDAASRDKDICVLPGERHGEGFKTATAQYKQAVTEFVDRVFPRH